MPNRPSLPMRRQALALLLTAWGLAAGLSAVELPVEAIVGIAPVGDGEDLDAGGAGVIVDAQRGLVLTLAEALPSADTKTAAPEPADGIVIVLPSGLRRQAHIVDDDNPSTAVLLQLEDPPADLTQVTATDSSSLQVGQRVSSIGNPFDAVGLDGHAAFSSGIVSGRYLIPASAPPVRGRRGAELSAYRGPVIETDAAVNDGDQGGALVDAAGRLVGLCSLGVARERRLGTAVPLARILPDLADWQPRLDPAPAPADPLLAALRTSAAAVAESMVLVYFQRPRGLGNPKGMPRPRPIDPSIPRYQREQLQELWDRYYHQQQVFYTDQAVPAVVIDAAKGLLLTAIGNLHGEAQEGLILDAGSPTLRCEVHATYKDLGLALLRSEAPLDRPNAPLATEPGLATGDPVGLVGRHRDGGPFTLTTGIVSATDRFFGHPRPYPLGQTDALANYGSLGGALIDVDGRMVGLLIKIGPTYPWAINSGIALYADSGSIALVLPQLAQGISTAESQRVGIGITQAHWQKGAVVVGGVLPGTGAADAGLRPGDRIVAVDGRALQGEDDLTRILVRHRLGDRVTLSLERDDELLQREVELRLLPQD